MPSPLQRRVSAFLALLRTPTPPVDEMIVRGQITVDPSPALAKALEQPLPSQDHIANTLTIYQIERSDAQNASALNAAVVSVALAYVVALVSFLSDSGNVTNIGWLAILTPFPVLSLNGYISMQVTTGIIRRAYLHDLEQHLPNQDCSAGPRFVSMYHAAMLHKVNFPAQLITLLTLWSPLITSTGFTCFVMTGPIVALNLDPNLVMWSWVTYIFMISLNVVVVVTMMVWSSVSPSSMLSLAEQRLGNAKSKWHK